MSQSVELDPVEEEALERIRSEGGVYQSDLWKELDISSRKASRIVSSLEEKDLILREEATYEGHSTYYLKSPFPDYSLLLAGDMLSPFVGNDDLDPIESDAFTQWILELAAEENA